MQPSSARTMDPLLLLGSFILVAVVLTWIIPAGQYDRVENSQTGTASVVPGSYKRLPSHPVGFGGLLLSIPAGLARAADIIFYVFLAGAALTVVELTGAIGAILDDLTKYLARRQLFVLPIVSLLFLFGGAAYSMSEEIIAFIPLLCALMRRLKLPNTMAVAVSFGSATVAAAFSPFNTFLLGISQPALGLHLFSGFAFRCVFFVIAIFAWMAYLILKAARMRGIPDVTAEVIPEVEKKAHPAATGARQYLVLLILNGGLAVMIVGAILWSWETSQFSALFIGIAVLAGIAGGLKLRGTSEAFAEGLRRVALAAFLAGFARAVSVILEDGKILDTITEILFRPLQHVAGSGTAVSMLVAQSLLNLPMPSDSGKAMLALPILSPLADLLHISRQIVASSYQYCTLGGLINPTYGAFLAMLALARVPYTKWLRLVVPVYLILFAVCIVALVVGVRIGLQ